MKTHQAALLLLAGFATALPQRRQIYDTTWNDPYIPEPINFQLQNAASPCDFQLVYERFSVDNRYSIDYIAEYPDDSQSQVNGISGTLARDNLWLVDGLEDDRAFQVVFFKDICQRGRTAPSSFRVNARLNEGFTYENDWTSGSFPLIAGPNTLPAAPQNVRLVSGSRSSTVTWSPVAGASGYAVLVRWLVDSELGPKTIPFVWTIQLGKDAISFTYNREFTHASVLAEGESRAFTSLGDTRDVRPS